MSKSLSVNSRWLLKNTYALSSGCCGTYDTLQRRMSDKHAASCRPHRRNGFRTSEDWKFLKKNLTSLLWLNTDSTTGATSYRNGTGSRKTRRRRRQHYQSNVRCLFGLEESRGVRDDPPREALVFRFSSALPASSRYWVFLPDR